MLRAICLIGVGVATLWLGVTTANAQLHEVDLFVTRQSDFVAMDPNGLFDTNERDFLPDWNLCDDVWPLRGPTIDTCPGPVDEVFYLWGRFSGSMIGDRIKYLALWVRTEPPGSYDPYIIQSVVYRHRYQAPVDPNDVWDRWTVDEPIDLDPFEPFGDALPDAEGIQNAQFPNNDLLCVVGAPYEQIFLIGAFRVQVPQYYEGTVTLQVEWQGVFVWPEVGPPYCPNVEIWESPGSSYAFNPCDQADSGVVVTFEAPGACCIGDVCSLRTESDCIDAGGQFIDHCTSCFPNPCIPPQGACCHADDTCSVTSSEDCDGEWLPQYSECTPNPCVPWGACCHGDGDCEFVDPATCTATGGTYLGDDVPCDAGTCFDSDVLQPPHPALDGFAAVSDFHWQPSDYYEIVRKQPFNPDPNVVGIEVHWEPEPPTFGACCDWTTGYCHDVNEPEDCWHTFHQGVLCQNLHPPCGEGACCFYDPPPGPGWDCAVMTETQCWDWYDESYFYLGQECWQIQCPPPAEPTTADAPPPGSLRDPPRGGRGMQGYRAADDWESEYRRVTHLRWWGYLAPGIEPIGFHLQIHDEHELYCKPEDHPPFTAPRWSHSANWYDVEQTSTYHPFIVQYDYDIPSWDWFDPPNDLGSKYWLDIAAEYGWFNVGTWYWWVSAVQDPNTAGQPPWLCPAADAYYPGDPVVWSSLLKDGQIVQMSFEIGTNELLAPQVNELAADNFVFGDESLRALRWWGSYIDPNYAPEIAEFPYEVDGWFISFHHDPNHACPPDKLLSDSPTVLGLYFAPASRTEIFNTGVMDCDGQNVYRYTIELTDCAWLCSETDPRTALEPAQRYVFEGTEGLEYWIGVQAVVGVRWNPGTHSLADGNESGRRPSPLGLHHFWGWHTSPITAPLDGACTGKVHDPNDTTGCWDYSDWAPLPWDCPGPPPADETDLAFETLVLPSGACCFADGHCEYLTGPDCAAAGGSWQGVRIPCDPNNPCPQPGACCFDDGHCEYLLESLCQTGGGAWQGELISCDPNPCPQPGACCQADGLCVMSPVVDPGDCGPGGVYIGDDSVCTAEDCNSNGVPDMCDIALGWSTDCNGNEMPDDCEWLRGDLNCDGVISFGDINPFTLAVTDPNNYAVQYPDCDIMTGDLNCDCSAGIGDINRFVECLINGWCDCP